MLDPTISEQMTADLTGNPGNPFASFYPYNYNTMENNNQNNDAAGIARNNIASNDNDNQIYGYDRFAYSENEPNTLEERPMTFVNEFTAPKSQRQKVQVTAEETGSQRVQVNNGFQEEFVPGLNPESGHLSSGVMLEWRLTFYGTGPDVAEDDKKGKDEEEEEEEEDTEDSSSDSD